ncbi:DegT/DnrJ/EryC1/StrS family aminotransferase [Bremerella cremea]|uniref:DegT/DnrJ/EryC1/StrS family aminotransferase n=1 Tax=Bremerella cremea TaxID=1031537 RepID=A0A368KSK9_9BACT|nr:DegT/DnrJ/EryC1/StrS family aminotransferase [Bremerella cremea]RCS52635.1 DegT/DnrJ/EryC1/StrS family aminotransferase [Bremerella cremea]
MTTANKGPASTGVSQVPLLDIGRGNAPLKEEFMAAFESVLDSGRFLFGPDVFELEETCATASQTKFGIGCASGSDALLLAMMALEIGPGDEVLVPSFTFFATASCVWRLGAKPVFVDIEPGSYNIDPTRLQEQITPNTKAIIPVHLFGQCANMTEINKIAQMHGIPVIEDAAQAILAEHNGQRAGSMSLAGCISFYPTKNLGGMGDGGMLVTSDEAFANKLKLLRGHGMEPRYYHQLVGINSRLDTLQAAALNVKMKHMAAWTEMRRQNAQKYTQLFAHCGLDLVVGLPTEEAGNHHVWNQYTIRVPRGGRDQLRKHLADHKIGSEIYYPVPLHQQQCFASLKEDLSPLPETEKAAEEVLALPIFPELTDAEQRAVVSSIARFYGIEANLEAPQQRKSA